jgi:spoIIIJ-associated protein
MSEISVEMTGETVGEAKWAAVRELERMHPGLDKAAVRFQVVTEGERGLLGVGYEPARVVASLDEEAAPTRGLVASARRDGDSDDAARLREVVERIAHEIGVQCTVEIEESEDEIRAVCDGHDLGMLIGRHGQTIDAIQYLANAILFRGRYDERKPVTVDAAGYRDRRQATLDARGPHGRAGVRDRAAGELEPMTAVERKIVHEAEGRPRGRDRQREPSPTASSSSSPPRRRLTSSSAGSRPSSRRRG